MKEPQFSSYGKRLNRDFFELPTLTVAKKLLGKAIVKGSLVGKIVETEAYIGTEDRASHASWRKREICKTMWGKPGLTYVYFTYGMHYMFNVVTEMEGFPAAVLIRAVEPLVGLDEMYKNRGLFRDGKRVFLKLTSGPAKFTMAFGIDKSFDGTDLVASDHIFLCDTKGEGSFKIEKAKRVGVSYSGEYQHKPWRFYIKGNRFVSKI